MKLAALLLTLVLVACAMSEQDFSADAQNCSSTSTDPNSRAHACTRLIISGRLPGNDISAAYFNRGAAYALAGQYETAIADFDTTVRFKPDLAPAYYNRGLAYARKGLYHKSIADMDTAIRLNPDFADAYVIRGAAHLGTLQYHRAIADLNAAIRLNPDAALAYATRGATYQALVQMGSASRDFRRAYELGHRPPKLVKWLRERDLLP